jgi:hypothetical protein
MLDSTLPNLNLSEIISSGDSIRSSTLLTITSELSKNHLMGLGALSIQWNNGFAPIFGKYFFLSDVGIFGELFQVGAIYPIFCLSLAVFIYYIVSNSASRVGRDCVICISAFIALGSPLGGVFQQLGFLFGFAYFLSRGTEHNGTLNA